MRVISADWVVPVDGAPIRDGAVAIADGGRIAAVGTLADLGEGEHFAEAVILPGFVNAHSHLEYAVYAGFGDGLDFTAWIGVHMERKRRIDLDEVDAIARYGALECLRSGITTVGDCSFSGSAATACGELGLRAIVYLEVFGSDGTALRERLEPTRDRVADAFDDRVRAGVSPHAPYSCYQSSIARAPIWGSHWRPISPRARPRTSGCASAQARGSRTRTSSSRRSAQRGSGHSQTKDCSVHTFSPPTACTWTTRRSLSSRRTTWRLRTVRVRTPFSDAASHR